MKKVWNWLWAKRWRRWGMLGFLLFLIGSVGSDLISDYAVLNVFLVWQPKMFLGRYIAKHRTSVPANHRSSNTGGDVVVARSDVSSQWAKRVEGCFVASFDLFLHIFLYHMHGHVTGTFVHHLTAVIPCSCGELALGLEFGKLWIVVSVSD